MESGLNDKNKKKKRQYIPPTITKLPLEEAKHLIVERTHCSDVQAIDLLDSMRHKLRQKGELAKPPAPDEKRTRSAQVGASREELTGHMNGNSSRSEKRLRSAREVK
jgi:hypothetical protein